jgi:hypothetical protein
MTPSKHRLFTDMGKDIHTDMGKDKDLLLRYTYIVYNNTTNVSFSPSSILIPKSNSKSICVSKSLSISISILSMRFAPVVMAC